MKIGITGDTHGSKQAIRQVLHAVPPVEYWFHTGDYSQDGRFLVAETKLPLLAVCGNTDLGEGKANVDEFITLAGQRIWLTHGHRYLHGYQVSELAWWARKLEADIVVFAPEEVTDKGTDDEPRRYPEGFRWVFVNGKSAMENGILTAGRSGQVLYTRPRSL